MKLQKSSPRRWHPKRPNAKVRRAAARACIRLNNFVGRMDKASWRALDLSVISRYRLSAYKKRKKFRVSGKPNRATRRIISRSMDRLGVGHRVVELQPQSLWITPTVYEGPK